MNDVVNDRDCQNNPGNPMNRYPWKLDPNDREKSGNQQYQHRGRHNPMKQSSCEVMSLDLVRDTSDGCGATTGRFPRQLRKPDSRVNHMKNNEGDTSPE
jgi:hypothetical protein